MCRDTKPSSRDCPTIKRRLNSITGDGPLPTLLPPPSSYWLTLSPPPPPPPPLSQQSQEEEAKVQEEGGWTVVAAASLTPMHQFGQQTLELYPHKE